MISMEVVAAAYPKTYGEQDVSILFNLVLSNSSHKTFTRSSKDEYAPNSIVVLKNKFVPDGVKLTFFGKRVKMLTEKECLNEGLTSFFEFTSVQIEPDTARIGYSYPEGAHFNTAIFEKVSTGWRLKNIEKVRSSSGRRQRLKAFYKRIPRQKIPEEIRSTDVDDCKKNVAEACYRLAIVDHNRGRLEKALNLYAKACERSYNPACHNMAGLEDELGNHEKARKIYSQLCKQGIQMSCRNLKRMGGSK